MPCNDGPRLEDELRERNTHLAQMLCWLMNRLEGHHAEWTAKALNTNHMLKMWWKEHKRLDAERKQLEEAKVKAEQVRQQAIAKLSPSERRALGL